MTNFEMVKYHSQSYPMNIPLRTEEIAVHFDSTQVKSTMRRSLHTEYSYGKRKFNSLLMKKYPVLAEANKEDVPQLWKSAEWADAFAAFIIDLNGNEVEPQIIEIHPPFSDYTNMAEFVNLYSLFEARIHSQFPHTDIFIENRCGSMYRGGKFILSKMKDIAVLSDYIQSRGLRLRIALDIPQIYTAHNASAEDQYILLLEDAKKYRQYIAGVHLWGKSYSRSGRKVSHCGNLDTYFENKDVKKHFLKTFAECFNDDMQRKMVLEVNSGNSDLSSIVTDLLSVGISFT